MKRYRIIYYAKYRRPLVVVTVRATNKIDALNAARAYMPQDAKGYIIQKIEVEVL